MRLLLLYTLFLNCDFVKSSIWFLFGHVAKLILLVTWCCVGINQSFNIFFFVFIFSYKVYAQKMSTSTTYKIHEKSSYIILMAWLGLAEAYDEEGWEWRLDSWPTWAGVARGDSSCPRFWVRAIKIGKIILVEKSMRQQSVKTTAHVWGDWGMKAGYLIKNLHEAFKILK